MYSLLSLAGLASGLLLTSLAAAAPTSSELDLRQPGSCHTPSNRACWSDGFDIYTDYEIKAPPGIVRNYNWTIEEIDNWMGPDGVVKEKVMLVNGQYPGPTLFADWGDTINVKITNNLETNGTSIHWHGLHMLNDNIHDGVNGVTECPIAPGKSKTYTFKATQYGTSWYHSHFSAQYGNGVYGAIQIDGPASLPYDIDLGVFPIADYYYGGADQIVLDTKHAGPPNSSNVLINGTNINPMDPTKGAYANVMLTPGKRHRLRLINPSVENNFQVSLVGHQMTVIATDLVPVNAFTTDNVFMATGQRYDVTIDASQAVDNYWFNVTLQTESKLCGLSDNPSPAAVFRYKGAPEDQLPTNPGTPIRQANCQDHTDFSPVLSRTVPLDKFTPGPASDLTVTLDTSPSFIWKVNGSAIDVAWDRPVLDYVLEGNTSYPAQQNLVHLRDAGIYTFWVIQNQSPLPHPMHLHGHDMLVLGYKDNAEFDVTADMSSLLRSRNPTRRDVTMLPAGGWVVVAWLTNNPGAWLLHCHIAWHVSHGLSVDFLERVDEMADQITPADRAAYEQTCSEWREYWPTAPFPKHDSGL